LGSGLWDTFPEMKMRIYEIASELGVDSKMLLVLLQNLGYQVTGITSILEESDTAEVIRKIGSLRKMSLDDDQLVDQTVPGELPEKVSHCIRCGKKLGIFRKRFRCTMCGAICCKQCHRIMPDQLEDITVPVFDYPAGTIICVTCFQDVVPVGEEKMAAARTGATRIDTWPASYRGQIPVDTTKPVHQIASPYFKDKQMALNSLRVTAAFLGCDLVYEVRYDRETKNQPTESGQGTEPYSVWRAMGSAGKRRSR
jgi:hypothetical protein